MSVDTFTICVGKDKKTVLFQPTKQLKHVLHKFCDSRNLNPSEYDIVDIDGNLVSEEMLLGELDAHQVILKRKDEQTVVVAEEEGYYYGDEIDLHSEASSSSRVSSSSDPLITTGGGGTTTDNEQIKQLQRQIQEKEKEMDKLKAQCKALNKSLKEYGYKDDDEDNDDDNNNDYGGDDDDEDINNTTFTKKSKKCASVQISRKLYVYGEEQKTQKKPPTGKQQHQQQIAEFKKDNERLKVTPFHGARRPKSTIIECFTDAEIATLLENEVVSRIVVCRRDLSLNPQGIHPDVVTLTQFIKKGHYLEKRDDNTNSFLSNVSKIFLKVYKSSGHTTNKLLFWMVQLVYVHDWLISEQRSGNKISVYGLDLPLSKKTKPSTHSSHQPDSFSKTLNQLICKIFRKLQYACFDLLKPLCARLVMVGDDEEGQTLSQVLGTLDKYLYAFAKYLVSDVLVLQFFNQLYHYMDTVMFNELLKAKQCSGLTGIQLKLVIARIDCWKYAHLKNYYVSEGEEANLYLPFQHIASFPHLTEATKLLLVDKSALLEAKFLKSQVAHLSPNHLHILLSKFVPDEYAPLKVPPEILEKFRLSYNNQDQWLLEEKKVHSILELKEYRL